MPRKDQHGLAELDLIALLQRIGLVFVDRLPVHFGAIGAAFVTQGIIARTHIDDRGVQARNRQVFEENVTFATASDAQRLLAYLIDAARLLPLLDAHIAQPGRTGTHWAQHRAVGIRVIKRTRAKSLTGGGGCAPARGLRLGLLLLPRGNGLVATWRCVRWLGSATGPRRTCLLW